MNKPILIFLYLSLIGLAMSCVSKKKFDSLAKEVDEIERRPILDLKDTDGDGVIDLLDIEKDTKEGCPVDTRGAILDSDKDGIPDCEDEEPYSPPNYKTGASGVAAVPEPIILDETDVNDLIDDKLKEPKALDINSLYFPEFNIPPPPYSKIEEYEINDLFDDPKVFHEIDSVLNDVLIKSGFVDENNKPRFYYYQIKMSDQFRGFAIVTDFEQINTKGRPLRNRFDLKVNKVKSKSILDYIFPARLNKGTFRFFAFLITDDYYEDRDRKAPLTKNQAITEFLLGANKLHRVIGEQELTPHCKLHILVYEYQQRESEADGQPTELKNLSVEEHLSKAGIWNRLKNR